MIYDFNGKSLTIPDKQLKKLESSLDLTREEAIETWLFDNDYIEDETVEELTKKAKENKAVQHGARKAKPGQKRKPRDTSDATKEDIVRYLHKMINDYNERVEECDIANPTKEIDFVLDEMPYTISLTRHRKNWKRK